jgi:tetratricopeptide (TPR) repeat protein
MLPLRALSDRWPALSALLDEALALPAPDRAAWLASLAGDRAELKDTLRELLEAHAGVETGDFLATLPKLHGAASAAAGGGELTPGLMVGPYRLIAELGQGGMGAVWLAERADGQVKRKVALKLPLVSRLRQNLAARFLRERDILARLEHPHIARLYDAGLDANGLPYLAMEYVEGQPIDKHCDQRQLGLQPRIELFEQVLQAVQYAHAHLVIHRDLKPSNILVTAEGQVRLLDFGIAKLLANDTGAEETALTQLSGRALTPDYASPEQIRGEPLTIATDVYSLGVVLYQLLSGQRPYQLKVASAAQLEQAILGVDPPRPGSVATEAAALQRGTTSRRLAKALAGDLDTIALKALAKVPAERYATVATLAQDLERHLRREPIGARPAGVGLRLLKLAQRNRAATAAVAGIFFSLAIGLAAALWQANVAREQARFANQALGKHEGVRHLYGELVTTIAGWDAATFAQPRAIPKLLTNKLEELAPQYENKQNDWAGVLNAAAVLFSFIGEPEPALKTSIEYLDVLKRTQADTRSIVLAHVSIGRHASLLGRRDQSEQALRQALTWVEEPADPPTATLRVFVLADLGIALLNVDRRGEAKTLLEAGRQLGAKYVPQELDYALLLAKLGRVEFGFDNRAALAALEQSQRIYLANKQTSNSELSENQLYLGRAYLELGRLEEAEKQFRAAHAVDAQLYGDTDQETLMALGSLALTLARREQYAEAAELLTKASGPLQAKTEPKYLAMAAALTGRQIEVALSAGDLPAARRALQSIGDPDALSTMVADRHVLPLARFELLLLDGRLDEAGVVLDRFRAAMTTKASPSERLLVRLADVRWRLARGAASEAADHADELVRSMRDAGVIGAWTLVRALEWAALATVEAGRTDRALALLDEASKSRNLITPPSPVEQADSELRQAQVLAKSGKAEQAQQLARSALDRLNKQHPGSPRLLLATRLRDGPA